MNIKYFMIYYNMDSIKTNILKSKTKSSNDRIINKSSKASSSTEKEEFMKVLEGIKQYGFKNCHNNNDIMDNNNYHIIYLPAYIYTDKNSMSYLQLSIYYDENFQCYIDISIDGCIVLKKKNGLYIMNFNNEQDIVNLIIHDMLLTIHCFNRQPSLENQQNIQENISQDLITHINNDYSYAIILLQDYLEQQRNNGLTDYQNISQQILKLQNNQNNHEKFPCKLCDLYENKRINNLRSKKQERLSSNANNNVIASKSIDNIIFWTIMIILLLIILFLIIYFIILFKK